MPTVALLNQTGETIQEITLDDSVFGSIPNTLSSRVISWIVSPV